MEISKNVEGNRGMENQRVRVLFLCTGNSCRSQMAEGWARHLKLDSLEAYSAGTNPQGLNPRAVEVMREVGVDISKQTSKHVDSLANVALDCVITVCGSAQENCPVFSGDVLRVHVGFDDPPKLALRAKSDAEALEHYRRVRDDIRCFVASLPDSLILK